MDVIRAGLEQFARAQDLARRAVRPQRDVIDRAGDLIEARQTARLGAALVKTGDQVIGSIIDILA